MNPNIQLMLISAATGGLLCGFVGAVAARGTSVLLPGLGLIIAGPLIGAVIGFFFGSILGFTVAALIILTRGKNYP